MNTNQENKLSMWLVLKAFLTEHASVTAEWPGYAPVFAKLADCINRVMDIEKEQGMNLKGYAKNKLEVKKELMLSVLNLVGKMKAFAVMTENVVLKQRISISKSVLKDLQDTLLIAKAQGVVDKAGELLVDAAAYGITQVLIDAAQELVNRYTTAVPQPKAWINTRKQKTAAMVAVFEEGDEAVRLIDALARIVEYTVPLFYMDYRSARKIVNTARRTRALQLWVRDAARGKPIVKAKVMLKTIDGEMVGKKVKKTGKSGSVILKHAPAGEYLYEVVMNGFVTESGRFFINHGKMTKVEVVMRGVKVAV